jgi:hypothetical protein
MHFIVLLAGAIGIATIGFASPAQAQAMKAKIAFNNTIGKETANQPAGGKTVGYSVKLSGGDLDGCTVDIVETLYGREEGSWGIFDIKGNVKCSDGGFAYTSSGSWDGKGFHGAGNIQDGSGTGRFQGIKGRIAQLGGQIGKADGGGFDISYELRVDPVRA